MDPYAWRWHLLVNRVAASPAVAPPLRARVLRRAGLDVRTHRVQAGCFFFGPDVVIGEGTWINHRCYFDTRDHVEIGARCSLGMEVMVLTSSHQIGAVDVRTGPYTSAPVKIGDGCWIGARALILPGVTVGARTVVGAGAVVTSDLEADGLYAGSPARRLRDL